MYVLHKEGNLEPSDRPTQKNDSNKAKFIIPSVTTLHAGKYHCYSYNSAGWSECSDTLELVVTGECLYNTQELSLHKTQTDSPEQPCCNSRTACTLSCTSNQGYNGFSLIKNNQKFSSSMGSQNVRTGLSSARFQVRLMTSSQRWRLRCYGYNTSNPQVWSEGSDILEILVSGTDENITISQNMSKPKTDSETQDHHTVENLLRIGMAGLVLVVLGILVFDACHSSRQDQHRNGL
ncbi:leukocyte immunoglobulin-like receptor subfamily A member 5 [Peromyscus eremicus]|uniref:leukocyte immunoglobulin-like receptor subfamily A member 5 n=1 Tax=Peromyscus eremicus TaxID=42410 RepID=UPI0027DC6148|nr:leukocyte immunoglobulin-like receptor subfamily A member 5 [Peromyscus eremicus]